MATSKIQVTLDDRLVALLGDDRSGNIKEAIIQLYKLNRMSLAPEFKVEYTGGAKPAGTIKSTVASTSTTHRPKPKPQPVDTRQRVAQYHWDELYADCWDGEPDMTVDEATAWMNERYVIV